MSRDRYLKQGLLSEKQQELKELESRAENLVVSLQSGTFVVESALDLDGANIVTAATDLAAVIKQGAIVRARIEELKNDLGIR